MTDGDRLMSSERRNHWWAIRPLCAKKFIGAPKWLFHQCYTIRPHNSTNCPLVQHNLVNLINDNGKLPNFVYHASLEL